MIGVKLVVVSVVIALAWCVASPARAESLNNAEWVMISPVSDRNSPPKRTASPLVSSEALASLRRNSCVRSVGLIRLELVNLARVGSSGNSVLAAKISPELLSDLASASQISSGVSDGRTWIVLEHGLRLLDMGADNVDAELERRIELVVVPGMSDTAPRSVVESVPITSSNRLGMRWPESLGNVSAVFVEPRGRSSASYSPPRILVGLRDNSSVCMDGLKTWIGALGKNSVGQRFDYAPERMSP